MDATGNGDDFFDVLYAAVLMMGRVSGAVPGLDTAQVCSSRIHALKSSTLEISFWIVGEISRVMVSYTFVEYIFPCILDRIAAGFGMIGSCGWVSICCLNAWRFWLLTITILVKLSMACLSWIGGVEVLERRILALYA